MDPSQEDGGLGKQHYIVWMKVIYGDYTGCVVLLVVLVFYNVYSGSHNRVIGS